MSKEITKYKEGFFIIQEKSENDVPLICPVCDFFIGTDQDVFYYTQHKCCFECSIKWAEGHNKEKWKNGWRPSKEEISKEKSRRRKLITPLRFT